MDVIPEKLNVPQSMEDLQHTILANMGKLCGILSKKGVSPEKVKEVEEILANLPNRFANEKKEREIQTKLNEFRRNHQLTRLRLLLGKAESIQKIAENANKKLLEHIETFPNPKTPTTPKINIPPVKAKSEEVTLLPAQQLRDQILKKIQELQTPPPRTTGNIWENWKQSNSGAPPASKDKNKDKDNQL